MLCLIVIVMDLHPWGVLPGFLSRVEPLFPEQNLPIDTRHESRQLRYAFSFGELITMVDYKA